MANTIVIELDEQRSTKNMVIYAADDGKDRIVPPYLNTEMLRKAFGRVPRRIRITVEEVG